MVADGRNIQHLFIAFCYCLVMFTCRKKGTKCVTYGYGRVTFIRPLGCETRSTNVYCHRMLWKIANCLCLLLNSVSIEWQIKILRPARCKKGISGIPDKKGISTANLELHICRFISFVNLRFKLRLTRDQARDPATKVPTWLTRKRPVVLYIPKGLPISVV